MRKRTSFVSLPGYMTSELSEESASTQKTNWRLPRVKQGAKLLLISTISQISRDPSHSVAEVQSIQAMGINCLAMKEGSLTDLICNIPLGIQGTADTEKANDTFTMTQIY